MTQVKTGNIYTKKQVEHIAEEYELAMHEMNESILLNSTSSCETGSAFFRKIPDGWKLLKITDDTGEKGEL